MDARLDARFESRGRFSATPLNLLDVLGTLSYEPRRGVTLVLNYREPHGPNALAFLAHCSLPPSCAVIHGELDDATPVTLLQCLPVRNHSGAGGVTTLAFAVDRALLGVHVDEFETLMLGRCSVTLSSLRNWMGAAPVKKEPAAGGGVRTGIDVRFRRPEPLRVTLPDSAFDVELSLQYGTSLESGSFVVHWDVCFSIIAHDCLAYTAADAASLQLRILLSTLIGQPVSIKTWAMSLPTESSQRELQSQLHVLNRQVGRPVEPDVLHSDMLLSYNELETEFPRIVQRWFARSEQEVLAGHVLFASQLLESPAVNVKFLAVLQAAEAYDRSRRDRVYMDQNAYDRAIDELGIPACIQDDHRQSFKSRLKYGNEYSLRKRLHCMLERIPESLRQPIAERVNLFVTRVVDTRNYYTHFDHTPQSNPLDGPDAFVAAERIRFLVLATLLLDLGISEEKLVRAFERNREFQHWTSEPLAL
jgi:hypothetical protein